MSEGVVQFVLRCEHCNKLFDRHSTLKRHGYYCRSRRAGRTTRTRSCISCAKGKTRCDSHRPTCSRCMTKAIECLYPVNTPNRTKSNIQHNDNVSVEPCDMTLPMVADPPCVVFDAEASNNNGMIFDTALDMMNPELGIYQEQHLDWTNADVNFADFLNPLMENESVRYPSIGSASTVYQSTPSTDQIVQVHRAISSPESRIPRTPTTYRVRSLVQRPKRDIGAQRIAKLILCTLKSYPLMVLRHNTLPPFCHQHMSSDVDDNDMEPLNNCLGLMHMIGSKVHGSRKLFWKNVRLECERLHEEHQSLNKWELLAAMQALSIYILLRLQEGETDHNNYDHLLLTTVVVIAKQLACSDISCDTSSEVYKYDLELSWKDWIFQESRRRLSVVYRIIDMLFYFEPAAMCDLQKDLVIAPLPARRELWEADDEFAWKRKCEGGSRTEEAFALAASGKLVRLDEGQLYCSNGMLLYKPLDGRTASSDTTCWEDWCSGMDGFGNLVMLAASLLA